MKFQRIQDLRTDADLSQRELSEILHISHGPKKNDQIKKSPELETVREIPLSGFPYCYRSGDSLFIQYNMFLLRHKGFHIYLCHPGTKYLHFHCNMHSHQKHFQHQYCLLLWMIRKMSLHLMYQKPLPFRHFPVLSIRHLLPAPPLS